MAESAYVRAFETQTSKYVGSLRHSAVVRVTHWIHALSFFALAVSGIAILLAHTRFYWGETGGEGTPSLFNLPLLLHRPNVSGWGRNLHFLAAWICVLNGLVYVLSGLVSQHFRKNLLPRKTLLSWSSITRTISDHVHLKRPCEEESSTYILLQRLAYLAVVFLFLPLIVLIGLAMSPNITSELPALVSIFGGQQSARTIPFFIANFLVLFLLV